jgi:glycosyltransferase involved in cell wall biosynthesis
VALIGRVVPIQDVKTFIRSVALLRATVPDVQAFVLGPTDEDAGYYDECVQLVYHLGLNDAVRFTGQVKLQEYLGRLDVVVLTSLSEAQPLVILEAGAAGIPVVATDVGACREMILGAVGAGGAITPLCNPTATAHELARLLTDRDWYAQCAGAIRERVRLHYDKRNVDRAYGEIYDKYGKVEDQWPASALNCAN